MLQVAPPWRRALVFAWTAACAPGDIATVAPGAVGGVERPGLRVQVGVDSADQPRADLLRWNRVPGAEVHLNRVGTAEWTVVASDSLGAVLFLKAQPGLHRLFGQRRVTGGEAEPLGTEAFAFGDGATPTVTPVGSTQDLRLYGHRDGGLLISEMGDGVPLPWETNGSYLANMYFEVYNAGDTTVYLDGVLFGRSSQPYIPTYVASCAEKAAVRTDSVGVHVRGLVQFPGSGRDHPVPPGAVRLIAVAAIDHRPVHPTLPDLRHADFELGCEGCGDNPAVPNLRVVGLSRFLPTSLFASRSVHLLARPLDLSQLPRVYADQAGEYYRIPAEALLDVVAWEHIRPDNDLELPPCVPMLHPRFDRYPGGFKRIGVAEPEDALVSFQRKVLRIDASGRKVLVNTNTTAVDFYRGERTPGWLPAAGEGW